MKMLTNVLPDKISNSSFLKLLFLSIQMTRNTAIVVHLLRTNPFFLPPKPLYLSHNWLECPSSHYIPWTPFFKELKQLDKFKLKWFTLLALSLHIICYWGKTSIRSSLNKLPFPWAIIQTNNWTLSGTDFSLPNQEWGNELTKREGLSINFFEQELIKYSPEASSIHLLLSCQDETSTMSSMWDIRTKTPKFLQIPSKPNTQLKGRKEALVHILWWWLVRIVFIFRYPCDYVHVPNVEELYKLFLGWFIWYLVTFLFSSVGTRCQINLFLKIRDGKQSINKPNLSKCLCYCINAPNLSGFEAGNTKVRHGI